MSPYAPTLSRETYEVVEAIDKKDSRLLCEELGDVMLQVRVPRADGKTKPAYSVSTM